MRINPELGVKIANILDCIPVVSAIFNLAQGIFCLLMGTKQNKTLSERIIVSTPIVGTIYKIHKLAQSRYNTKALEEKRPLLQPSTKIQASSISLSAQTSGYVKAPKDLAEFVGINTPQKGGYEFSQGGDAANTIISFRNKIPGLCNRIVVKGDGHCLFRSTAYSLLTNARHNPALKVHLKGSLDRFITTASAAHINHPDITQAASLVKNAIDSEADPLILLNDEPVSDALVKALRQLSCFHTFIRAQAPDERFSLLLIENLTDADQADMNKYLREMSDVKANTSGKFGSGLEIEALSNIFNINTIVFNFAPLMAPTDIFRPLNGIAALTMCLYFRQSHYDSMMINEAYIQSILA